MEDGVGNLFSFSLAKREDGDAFSIHTITQTCVRQRLSTPQRRRFVESAILVVAGAVRELSSERQQGWHTYRQLLSHIKSCEGYLDDSLQRTTSVLTTKAIFILGQFCDQLGQHDQAILWFKKGLDTAADLSMLSSFVGRDGIFTAMLNRGQWHEALANFKTLYDEAVPRLGLQHELTNKIANSLGITSKKIGFLDEALKWYEISLSQVREKFGERDQRTLATLNNIAVIYKEQKEYEKALGIFQHVLQEKEAALGKENSSTLETVMNVGILHGRLDRYNEAHHFLQRALCGWEKQLGKDNLKTLGVKGNIANLYLRSRRLEEAIKLHEETYNGYKKAYGPMHPDIFTTADWLGTDYCQKGMYAESLRWYNEALSGRQKLLGEGNAKTLETVASMAIVYQLQGRLYCAMMWYKRALDGFRDGFGLKHSAAQSVESQLRALLLQWHQKTREKRFR